LLQYRHMSIEQFLINKKIAKDKKGAEKVMIGIIALCVLFFIVRGFTGNDEPSNSELPVAEQELAGFGTERELGFEANPEATR
jgi:hypothetical protein